MTLAIIGFALIFFLPVIESFNRQMGFDLLLIASFLISFKTIHEGKIKIDKTVAVWILMLTAFSLSIFNSIAPFRSYVEFLRYVAYFLIFITVRNVAGRNDLVKKIYLPTVFINAIILFALSVYWMIPAVKASPPLDVNLSWGMNLFYPTFGHNQIVNILIFAVPLSLSLLLISKKKLTKIFWLILFIFYLFFFILSFGRAAMIGLTLAVFLYILIIGRKDRIWQWIGIILGFFTSFLLVLIFILSNYFAPYKTGILLLDKLYRPFVNDYHLANDYQALVAWREKPILGMGLNSFRVIAGRIPPVNVDWYTHNHYLEILSETGIIGIVMFIGLLLTLFINIRQRITKHLDSHNSHLEKGIFIACLASSIQSFFDYQWHFLSVFLFFWMGLALLYPAKISNTQKLRLPWNMFLFVVIILFLVAFESPFHNFQNIY